MAVHPDHAQLCKLFPDVDPFVLKKWERVFYVFFDQNASEAVDWGDFALVMRHCRDIYGAQSAQMTYAREAMKKLWEGLKKEADTNKDNLISLEEWCVVLKTTDPKHENKWFADYLEFMFKLFDVSADGKVDQFEYTDGMHAHGFDDAAAAVAFKLIAVDKKGNAVPDLPKDQWMERFHEYFHSCSRDAPGNHLFGKLPESF